MEEKLGRLRSLQRFQPQRAGSLLPVSPARLGWSRPRSQPVQKRGEPHYWHLLFKCGLRYNRNGNHPGAKTERRGGAGPVGACLAVRTSPADLPLPSKRVISSEHTVAAADCSQRQRKSYARRADFLQVLQLNAIARVMEQAEQ